MTVSNETLKEVEAALAAGNSAASALLQVSVCSSQLGLADEVMHRTTVALAKLRKEMGSSTND